MQEISGRAQSVKTKLILLLSLAPTATPLFANDLSNLSLDELLKLNVTGASKYEQKASQVAANVKIITRNEIKSYGWRTIDEALASLPGVYTNNDRQTTNLGTRGFGTPGDFTTRVLLTIDGNRVNDALYDMALLGRMFPVDIDLIERIEYIPGPGGAVYGNNAMFGVINVVTRTGANIDATELAGALHDPQSAAEGRATWARKLENGLDAVFSASGYFAKGQNLPFVYPGAGPSGSTISGVAAGMDGETAKSLFGHLTYGSWSLQSSYADQRKDDPTAAFHSDPLVPGQYQRNRSLLTQLQYQNKFADDSLQITGRLFHGMERYSGLEYYSGAPLLSLGNSDWLGGEFRILSTQVDSHKLLTGVEYQNNMHRDQSQIFPLNNANNYAIPGSSWRMGGYIQDDWALTDTLNLTLGLRYDDNNIIGGRFSPRTGLIWQAWSTTTFKALYGRAHRAPNAYERDYYDGVTIEANQKLTDETIDTFELVIYQRIGSSLLLNASVYQWYMQNLITQLLDAKTGLLQYQNDGNVKASGLEFSIDKTWEWGGRLRSSLSYQKTGYTNRPAYQVDNSPQLMGKLNFSTPLAETDLRLGYELQYYSSRLLLNNPNINEYLLSNINLLADNWAKGLNVSLGVYNLFDAHYQNPDFNNSWQSAIEQNGRQFRLKFVYAF